MWLITCFIFLHLKSLKLWQYRNKRNIFYQQGYEIVILIIWSHEKAVLIHEAHKESNLGCLKKVNEAEGQGPWVKEKWDPNKNMLEWFLVIICKEYTLTRSANLFSRNHPTLRFWLRRKISRCPILNFIKLIKIATGGVL